VVERIRHNDSYDTLLQSISDAAATAYVLRNLNPDSCSRCYWVQLFKEYSKFERQGTQATSFDIMWYSAVLSQH